MKIRTDFVTNSSSSSYITVTVETKSRRQIYASFEGYQPIDPKSHSGCLHIEQETFESGETLEPIVKILMDWIYQSMEDPECSPDEFETFVATYGSGEMDELLKVKTSDVLTVSVSSSMEYWDEPYGKSILKYNYEEKKLSEQHYEGYEDDYYDDELVCEEDYEDCEEDE